MEYARNRGGGSSSVFSRRPDEGAQGRRRRAAARGRRTRGQLSRRLRAASAVPASSPASCLQRGHRRSSSPTAVASRAGRPSAPPIPSPMAAARSFLAAAPLPAAAHPPFPSSPAASFARICGTPPSSVRVELPPAPPACAAGTRRRAWSSELPRPADGGARRVGARLAAARTRTRGRPSFFRAIPLPSGRGGGVRAGGGAVQGENGEREKERERLVSVPHQR